MKLSLLALPFALSLAACASSTEAPSSDDNVTAGTASATLAKKSYKGSVPAKDNASVKCTYDLSWFEVTNLSTTVRAAVNRELNGSQTGGVPACEDPGEDLSSGAQLIANTAGVVSVIYSYDQFQNGAAHPNVYFRMVNVDLISGKRITLANIADAVGQKTIISNCQAQWGKLATANGESANGSECAGALQSHTEGGLFFGERFTLTKEGIHVHIDSQVSRNALPILPDGGFLVPWTALKGHLTSEAASRLSQVK